MRWRRLALWGVILLGLTMGLVFAFWPRPLPVDLVSVVRGPLVVTVDEEAETRVRDVFVLSAPVGGRLRRIDADVGDRVFAEETVIARIEPADPAFLDRRSEGQAEAAVQAAEANQALARAELAEAQAELDFAGTDLERARRLIRSSTISQRALDEAERLFKTRQAAVETAAAGLKMRRFELDQARARLVSPIETQSLHGACECVPISAPVSGRVLRLLRESEGVVQAGDPLVEIGDPADLEIVSDLLSSDAVKVAPGQRVVIEDWGGKAALGGTVRRVEPTGFMKVSALGIEEQRVNVIIDLTGDAGGWRRLGHGYRVEVRIVLWEDPAVLKVPLTALFREGEGWALFVDDEGRARRRSVTLGHRSGLEAEIVEGLAEDERVIEHPSASVVDGRAITARR